MGLNELITLRDFDLNDDSLTNAPAMDWQLGLCYLSSYFISVAVNARQARNAWKSSSLKYMKRQICRN